MELIFVHGALVRDGQWWWQRTADLLRDRTGISSRAVALPSCGETTPEQVAAGAFTTPTSAAGWQGVDSTYIVCGQDRSTSLELQLLRAARATRSVELPTGHHRFISRPDLVVDQVQALLQRA
jgi:pimeloyl-ACP methyl ester carboxylesterase